MCTLCRMNVVALQVYVIVRMCSLIVMLFKVGSNHHQPCLKLSKHVRH